MAAAAAAAADAVLCSKPCSLQNADKSFTDGTIYVYASLARFMARGGSGQRLDLDIRGIRGARAARRLLQGAGLHDEGLQERARGAAFDVWRTHRLCFDGCQSCWSSWLLSALERLGLVQASQWQRGQGPSLEGLRGLVFDEAAVWGALWGRSLDRWRPLAGEGDPREAAAGEVMWRTHAAWVYPVEPQVQKWERRSAPQYTRLCSPFGLLRFQARLRLGCEMLEIRAGRMRRPALPREERVCPLCLEGGAQRVEDLMHFCLECPAYAGIRAQCPAVSHRRGTAQLPLRAPPTCGA